MVFARRGRMTASFNSATVAKQRENIPWIPPEFIRLKEIDSPPMQSLVRRLTGPRPKLLDEVREAIRTRHYSPKTEESYVHWIKRFIFFHNKRHPGDRVTKKLRSFFQALPANCT
jgi:Phage integrase, N-terminal SAM-like domain